MAERPGPSWAMLFKARLILILVFVKTLPRISTPNLVLIYQALEFFFLESP